MYTSNNIEQHPLEPFLPSNASVLMLGSFPPQRKRWSMDFFYPNLQNDMWRIFGYIFFNDREYFLTENKKAFNKTLLEAFLKEKGIALYDTASSVIRLQDNASDKFLEVVEPTDIGLLLKQIPQCKAIITTGQKATDLVCEYFSVKQPAIGNKTEINYLDRQLFLYRMPSSSRAYPLKLEKKSELYAQAFNDLNILH
ncbi:uracil-DNA glycosylase family protein [Bacteroides caecigallinarum]|uniref:uracil-DNA glycosylase family protein n=1 Tax=Bacteroides caecigallinarum TaxID=1411144 RepID=UPI0019595CD7|nr:uracil-DNA glycosylase family protein [Bacteroides caecigallinarum]MBM6883524.1 uracil-DNA glycosylase family protein [Bacteroides caecigallinarum]MBM6890897.1 uracil-DNA glycosylase family protein [Bacteroides caecigallinarum]MCF2553138.1 uracil-DNA glycosylase family protein [Bacteroides caecigallinarum]